MFYYYYRLESLYREKFGKENKVGRKIMGRDIMKLYHPEIPDHKNDGSIAFTDLIHYIEDGHRDPHWAGPYHLNCAPCTVKYDYIVKLETQDTDGEYIIKEKLKGRGLGTKVHQKREKSSSMLGAGRQLGVYNRLPPKQVKFLHNRLQPDLEMFGYSFDESSAVAKCGYADRCC